MVDYVTVAEVAAQSNISTTAYNDKLEVLISNVSSMINRYCQRPHGFLADSSASTRLFVGSGNAVQYIDETPEITLVEVKDSITDTTYTSWAATDWIAFSGSTKSPNYQPITADESKPYTKLAVLLSGNYVHFTSGLANHTRPGFKPPMVRVTTDFGQPTVRVTAKWGYAASTPVTVKQACLIEISRWFGQSEAGWTDTLASSDFQELRVSKDLHPITRMMLDKSGLKRPMGM